MSEKSAAGSRASRPAADAASQESADPGHFARQGYYDDPRASLVHDDAVGPDAWGSEQVRDPVAPQGEAVIADPEYLAWREAQMRNLDEVYGAWREAQARSYDRAYLKWRDASVSSDFSLWRDAAAALCRASAGRWTGTGHGDTAPASPGEPPPARKKG